MIYLVSGSVKTLSQLAPTHGSRLGFLTTPSNRNSPACFTRLGLPWAADNGAYSGFDAAKFRRLLARVRGLERCLFVVCPDVVANAKSTLALFGEWRDEVASYGQPVAFVGQDGAEGIEIPWGSFGAWFIGGSTEWKLSRASADLAAEAKRRGRWVHMGRVNSLKRMRLAYEMGCDSVDGSSASMYGDRCIHKYCRWLDGICSQPLLFGLGGREEEG